MQLTPIPSSITLPNRYFCVGPCSTTVLVWLFSLDEANSGNHWWLAVGLKKKDKNPRCPLTFARVNLQRLVSGANYVAVGRSDQEG